MFLHCCAFLRSFYKFYGWSNQLALIVRNTVYQLAHFINDLPILTTPSSSAVAKNLLFSFTSIYKEAQQ